jgi:hypothetical protein
MKSVTTAEFRKLLRDLPNEIRGQAFKAYRLWWSDQRHPAVRYKKVHENPAVWSASIGIHYRALAAINGDRVVWFWIGSHAEYDHILRNL